jgi:hypothetical protein
VDYAESYAHVATACSICVVVALAAGHNMTIGIDNIKNAFQNTMLPVSQPAHLTMPPYYLQWFCRKYPIVKIEPLASEADKYCLQSVNAIQETKPAGNQWNKILTNVLQHHKYKQNHISIMLFLSIIFSIRRKVRLSVSLPIIFSVHSLINHFLTIMTSRSKLKQPFFEK